MDSKGDVYVASAGESKIRIFDSAHTELKSIDNTNEPCGLAVDGKGILYVSEKGTGKVVKYVPVAYPFVGPPAYGSPIVVDGSGNAKGIAVDRNDDRLYVAEGDHVAVYKSDGSFEANLGGGDLSEATGVAAYTYPYSIARNFEGKVIEEKATRHVFVADAATDQIKVFSGAVLNPGVASIANPKLRRTIGGVDHDRDPETADQALAFGAAGAYLAADPGNRSSDEKCASVAEQACTAGHFLVYDAGHEAVDEFDASGDFLDQLSDAAFADGEPTAMGIDRSGGAHDGTIYATADAGPGAKLLAFGPLAAPARAPLSEPLSHVLATAGAVATDSRGDVYVAAGSLVHVYGPAGNALTTFEDTHFPLEDLAVDSSGKVYVLEDGEQVAYYTPGAFPPGISTTYSRHEPIATSPEFSNEKLFAIALNPGPSLGRDHLFVTAGPITREYASAANGSTLLDSGFAESLELGPRVSIAVDGVSGNVYFGANNRPIAVVDGQGEEVLVRINGAGGPKGSFGANPSVTVDQSNGHVLAFANSAGGAREYDASGAFVAEFGQFTNNILRPYRIAIDNSCALHEPPLTESTTPTCEEFDPADGNAYVAFDDTKANTPDLWAFDRLAYGEAPLAVTGTASGLGSGSATLHGTVNPNGFDLGECKFEYLLDGESFPGVLQAPCVPDAASVGKGTAPVAVSAGVSGLDPEERYEFRLVASNKYGTAEGDPVLFGPPLIAPLSALPVLYSEATLRAKVDPSGLSTEYHFEYGEGAGEYDHSTTVEEVPGGAGPTDVHAAITDLEEGTEYHFRLVAENEAKLVPGLDQVFATLRRRPAESCPNAGYRSGLSANLPDCRAYELATPAETNGLAPYAAGTGSPGAGFNNWLVAPREAGAGESFSYFTDGTLPGFDGSGRLDGYTARRNEGEHPEAGWSTERFGPSYVQAGGGIPNQRGVSADQLYSFWKVPPLQNFEGTLPKGIYLSTLDGSAGSACNPEPLQSALELVGCGTAGTDPEAESRYVSPGGAHVIFASTEHLEDEAAPIGTLAIYDRAAGAASASVISLEPDGSAFGPGENASFVASTEDGDAVVFRVGGSLYLHREGQTLAIAGAPNTFAGISEDGERVFYAAAGSGNAPAGLFVCDAQAGPCVGSGAHSPTQIAANAIFANVSRDGSHVFFTSKDALTGLEENDAGDTAVANEHNLYDWDEAGTAFIAVLDPQDFVSFAGIPGMSIAAWATAINPGTAIGRAYSPTRSTADGGVFVFQSHARLTAYDNEKLGQKLGEIYRYDPAAAAGERLTCSSCDPGNSPPSADALLQDVRSGTGITGETLNPNVTEDGTTVFFQSPDRLLPEDANSVIDVYEWRAKGSGDCERSGGCLALISSGQGETPSYLYGMSADGHDVFFRTLEKLVGADVVGSTSVYDAREGGGIPEAPATEGCQGDACQGNGSPPPVLPAPASTGSENGNVTEDKPATCGKGRHRVKGRCVKPHKKQHRHRKHRRAGTGRGARR